MVFASFPSAITSKSLNRFSYIYQYISLFLLGVFKIGSGKVQKSYIWNLINDILTFIPLQARLVHLLGVKGALNVM